jgi:flavin-binding protein dodecin
MTSHLSCIIRTLPLALVCGLVSCATQPKAVSPVQQAFPKLSAELQRHAQAQSQVVFPVLIHSVKPIYPPLRGEGTVTGVIRVGPDGRVHEVKVVGEAPEPFQQAIHSALMQWRFKPGTINGRTATFPMSMKITFRGINSKSKAQVHAQDGIKLSSNYLVTQTLFPELHAELAAAHRQGLKLLPPKPLKITRPSFPNLPAQGSIWVAFVITDRGWVEKIRIIGETPKSYQKAIADAAQEWQFQPATIGGRRHAYPAAGQMHFRTQTTFMLKP